MKIYDQTAFFLEKFHKICPNWIFSILTVIALFSGYMGHHTVRAESDSTNQCSGDDAQNMFGWLGLSPQYVDKENIVTLNNVTLTRELFWSLQLALVPEVVDFLPIYLYPCDDKYQCKNHIENLLKVKKAYGTSDRYVGVACYFGGAGGTVVRALPLSDQNMQEIADNLGSGQSGLSYPLNIVSGRRIPGVKQYEKLWASADKKSYWNPATATATQKK